LLILSQLAKAKERIIQNQDCMHDFQVKTDHTFETFGGDMYKLWQVVRAQGKTIETLEKRVVAQDRMIAKAVWLSEEVCFNTSPEFSGLISAKGL
jgi:hypothetical protein